MKLLRAALLGVLIWVLIFVEISIFKVGLELSETLQNVIHYILLVPITFFAAWFYYKSKDDINGFLLGIIFLVVGTILDLVITAPLFTSYSELYLDPYLWVGFVELVVLTGTYRLMTKAEEPIPTK